MQRLGPKSVRGRVTLVATVASAMAMVLVSAYVVSGTASAVRAIITRQLESRLDAAEACVAAGDLSGAVAETGSELVVVSDAAGKVVASSANGFSSLVSRVVRVTGEALVGEHGIELDDFELDDDPEDDDHADGPEADDDDVYDGATTDARDMSPEASGSVLREDVQDTHIEYDDDNDGPDYDDDDLHDDDDYPDFDDDDDDNDDEDDDDDDDTHEASWSISALGLGPTVAHAEPARLMASDALGVPGPFLVLQREVEGPDQTYVITAMSSVAAVEREAVRVAWRLALIFAVLLAAIGAGTWVLVGRTLLPVERMREATESISALDLSQRVPVPDADRDLAPLAETLNDLLARTERALAEEKRFISDASHELKSPLASSRVMLEAIATQPGGIDVMQVAADLLAENDRMQAIVEDLLALARYDECTAVLDMGPTDLMDVVFEQVSFVQIHSRVPIDTGDVEPIVLTSDRQQLGHAIRNLLDNAVSYAKERVWIACSSDGETVQIVVSDDGCGISPEDRERVFGRFVRLEQGRERRSGSTGLGLSVVQSIAVQHGGSVRFVDGVHGGATAVMELPLT